MAKIIIDPVNRMEGHIGIDASITNAESNGYRIIANGAKLKGNMYRGFENILSKRDPRDAMVITQRHCGVCPFGHGMASSKNIGTAFRYQVHYEDKLPKAQRPLKGWTNKTLPQNAARFRNIIHLGNHLMSHILHFYHLVALDYVKPVVWNGSAFAPLTRPFLAPRYDDNYYINTTRVLAVAPLLPAVAVTTLSGLPGWGVDPGDAINNYLTGQYLRALNIRRMTHEFLAIFGGRAPHGSGFTPGGATSNTSQADIDKAREILYKGSGGSGTPSSPAPGTIMDFVGDPLDFANGKAGTMMFDTVAAAHLFPEYFWIGNSCGNFMSFGWGEEAGTINYSDSVYGGLLFPGGKTNTDQRALARGWYAGGVNGCIPPINVQAVNIMNIGESVQTGSRYKPYAGFKHPWTGVTNPDPEGLKGSVGYSWLKAPRYDTTGSGNWTVFEVGPLSRLIVNGCYWAGILNTAGYTVTPTAGAAGPDCATGADALGAALQPVYAAIPPARTGGPNLSGVAYNGDSVLDRIATRTLETRMFCDQAKHFLDLVEGTVSGGYATTGITDDTIPVLDKVKKGYGMTEASRGALSHWIKYKNGKIKKYQAVVPTTWNASPRDANGNPGPSEQSLMSDGGLWVADPSQAIECIRVTHSYDFCIACAVHLITPKGDVVKVDVPALP
jgi:hydrogenase large subunit